MVILNSLARCMHLPIVLTSMISYHIDIFFFSSCNLINVYFHIDWN
uniref:Uncharacterized protein n=1 Tax=Arundo donax TaxID=35708 RepID=A0A0A9HAK4_ARUDO